MESGHLFLSKYYMTCEFCALIPFLCPDVLMEKSGGQYGCFSTKNHHFPKISPEQAPFNITFRQLKAQNDNFYLITTSFYVQKLILSQKKQNSKSYF